CGGFREAKAIDPGVGGFADGLHFSGISGDIDRAADRDCAGSDDLGDAGFANGNAAAGGRLRMDSDAENRAIVCSRGKNAFARGPGGFLPVAAISVTWTGTVRAATAT